MQVLRFKSLVKKGVLYGNRNTLTPGIIGPFVGIPEATDVFGMLLGNDPFVEGRVVPFEPLGFFRVLDRGSIETIIIGVNALVLPPEEIIHQLYDSAFEFIRKNYIVTSVGDATSAERMITKLSGGTNATSY